MSKISKNKKYLELEGVRVYVNPKDNTIQIISTDEDLTGKPFQITLNQGTPSEQSLREILVEKKMVEETIDPFYSIPKHIKYPKTRGIKNIETSNEENWNLVPIGVTSNKEPVCLDLKENPNTLIAGRPGGGKTVALKNILIHTLKDEEKWKIAAIDLRKIDLNYLVPYTDSVLGIARKLEDAVTLLDYIKEIIQDRKIKMATQGVTNYRDLKDENGNPVPSIMLAIDAADELLFNKHFLHQNNNDYWVSIKTLTHNLLKQILKEGSYAGIYTIINISNPEDLDLGFKEFFGTVMNVGGLDGFGFMELFNQRLLNEAHKRLTTGQSLLQSKSVIVNGTRKLLTEKELLPFQIYYSSDDLKSELSIK